MKNNDEQRKKNNDLFLAIRLNDIQKMKFCLKDGAEINCTHPADDQHNTGYPLCLALSVDNDEAAQYLLDNGADVNGMKGGAVIHAIYRGNYIILEELLKRNVLVSHKALNMIGETDKNTIPTVKVLLDYGAKPQDLLLIAISSQKEEMKKYLLDFMAKKNLNERLNEKLSDINTNKNTFKI